MTNIEFGDTVRHKSNNIYNFSLMTVTGDVEDGKVKCRYYDKGQVSKEELFDIVDLELVEKTDGGFTQ